jgi:hypothetical protein
MAETVCPTPQICEICGICGFKFGIWVKQTLRICLKTLLADIACLGLGGSIISPLAIIL